MKERESAIKPIATNRKARHDFFISETFEAGIGLTGSEIKSVRARRVNLRDSYVVIKSGEAWLVGTHISPYPQSRENPDPKRSRRLLLNKHEIARLAGKAKEKGFTIVPLSMYLKNNRAKVEIALARGKRLYEKRAAIAEREAREEIERALAQRRKHGSR